MLRFFSTNCNNYGVSTVIQWSPHNRTRSRKLFLRGAAYNEISKTLSLSNKLNFWSKGQLTKITWLKFRHNLFHFVFQIEMTAECPGAKMSQGFRNFFPYRNFDAWPNIISKKSTFFFTKPLIFHKKIYFGH